MITTERLFVEKLSEKDTHFIFELLNTEDWIRYIGNRNIHSEVDALKYIQKINKNSDTTYWKVVLQETDNSIGLITLIKRDYLDFSDIGFAFLPAYYHKGYAYEAAKAVLESLSENTTAITLPENTSSVKLIEKLGLKFEKTIQAECEILFLYSNSNIMTDDNYTCTITFDATAEKVFNALTNEIPLWWTVSFEGSSNQQRDVFTIRFGEHIYKTMQVCELSPNSKVIWYVTGSVIGISELNNQTEWTGTTIVWEITQREKNTELILTHIGLSPDVECYDICKNGWKQFTDSLKLLLETGTGNPFHQ